MNNATGDFYNIATAVAAEGFLNANSEEKRNLRKLLNSKDNIDGQKILEHMGEFSCKEEMERYAEQCELES